MSESVEYWREVTNQQAEQEEAWHEVVLFHADVRRGYHNTLKEMEVESGKSGIKGG